MSDFFYQKAGKSSFKYAWIMDRLKAERQRGVTIDSKIRRFDSRRFHVNMIDVPGHKDYVHNMVTGTTQVNLNRQMILQVKCTDLLE